MTTPNLNTHVARAAAYLAECEDRARATQAAMIEAQRAVVAATPTYCPAGECAELLAKAAAADAVNGTRTADALKGRLEKERADAEARFTAQREAEVAAKEAGERHAQAEAYLRAARAGFEVAVQAAARKLAAEAVKKYGTALNALLAAHGDYVVAIAAATPGGLPAGQLLPAIPTFGAEKVASAFASTDNGHVYYRQAEPAIQDRARALRAQIVAGQVE